MDESNTPSHLRIFIASPGDVADERALAKRVIADINGDSAYRDRVRLEVVAWDRDSPATPLEAVLSPQEAIARDLPRPSDCAVVAVIVWSRLGTALDPDAALDPPPVDESGNPRTGTTWEYADALAAAERSGRPIHPRQRLQGADSVAPPCLIRSGFNRDSTSVDSSQGAVQIVPMGVP